MVAGMPSTYRRTPRTPKVERAYAAHGQLQVLGVVLAVLDLQAGHAGQAFEEVDLQLAVAQLLAIEHRGRGGQGLQAGGAGGGAHFDRLQRGGSVWAWADAARPVSRRARAGGRQVTVMACGN